MSDFDPTQGTAPATSTAVDTPASATATQTAPPGATNPAPSFGGQPTAQPAATSGAPGSEATIPSHVLRERTQRYNAAINEARQREAALEARLQEAEKRVQALAGFGPQPNPEVDQVKQQFAQLYPGLARLADIDPDRLLQALQRMGDFEQQNDHYWQSYGYSRLNELFDLAAKDVGQELSQAGKARLHSALIGYIQSSPEAEVAYARDPNFVKEFWKAWSSDFIEPVRRVSAAGAQTRAGVPLPQDTPGQVRTQPAQQPQNLDERLAMSWTAYQQSRKP